ncbi:6906_t:CDS:2 [Ambispora gerdemannii]|uniref:6906_t:CDS:1 n=1 Tax=Ambispora gerdemannii TaxID=144530 RepID=A0A9N9CZC9_9GLOM|nr:6906_t:CDS:2 [Ambispora gerdemannii]
MDTLQEISKQYFRTDLPPLQVGDKVEITTKNFNKNEKAKNEEKPKLRLTHFKGTVIGQKNPGQISYTFSVLKESKGRWEKLAGGHLVAPPQRRKKPSRKQIIALALFFSLLILEGLFIDKEYHKQDQNTKEIIQKAEKVGVKYILNVGYDKESNEKVIEQLKQFSNLYGALGLHPNSNEDLEEENLQ